MMRDLFLGLDLGTSGVRALILDAGGAVQASGRAQMATFGANPRDPAIWWQATKVALHSALMQVDRSRIRAIAVDGTSGTLLAVDPAGHPLAEAVMYNDACTDPTILARIAEYAPQSSAAQGASSGLARAIGLQRHAPAKLLHQADWIAFQLGGQMGTDANNALKTGYDPVEGVWPDWIAQTGLQPELLPQCLDPGSPSGQLTAQTAQEFGLNREVQLIAGTTDGCASFLATGADTAGAAVSVIGTTLTLKILSDRPIFAPHYGIYSHKILGMWLAGGASNSGGAALLAHFSAEEMQALTPLIQANKPLNLGYYPLPKTGERFPIADPDLPSRVSPRPSSDAQFLQALFEGLAAIEALGYQRLHDLGAPALTSLRSLGGAAANPALGAIRARLLGVESAQPLSREAAYGSALLARRGAQ
jgi:D-ribulokinase